VLPPPPLPCALLLLALLPLLPPPLLLLLVLLPPPLHCALLVQLPVLLLPLLLCCVAAPPVSLPLHLPLLLPVLERWWQLPSWHASEVGCLGRAPAQVMHGRRHVLETIPLGIRRRTPSLCLMRAMFVHWPALVARFHGPVRLPGVNHTARVPGLPTHMPCLEDPPTLLSSPLSQPAVRTPCGNPPC
jgi:hypothetical protein